MRTLFYISYCKVFLRKSFTSAKRKLKNSRSIPTTNCPPKQDKPNDRNVVIDNCKGFLRNVWGVFCPGKSKPKKKTDGIIRCHSLPSMMPTEMSEYAYIKFLYGL